MNDDVWQRRPGEQAATSTYFATRTVQEDKDEKEEEKIKTLSAATSPPS